MYYPKLLIINNYSFNDYKGGGITLRNLFLGWPKDKLAIAHASDSKPMLNVCENYFKIGYNESHYVFPINKISNEPRGIINGPYSEKDFEVSHESSDKINNSIVTVAPTNHIKAWFLNFINKAGLYEFVHPLRLSKSLREWILEFNPEIIYCQPESISFINLILEAQNLTKVKVVVHVMDDWPFLIYKDNTFSYFLRGLVNCKFKKLLNLSSLRLGISRAMADEFKSRYNQPFKYFHNPIDISKANSINNSVKSEKSEYTIVYSGRIGWTASHDSIIEFSRCIEQLRIDGMNIRLDIHTDLSDKENDFTLFQYDGTSILPALKDDNFITKLQKADLLLYPVDFDRKSIEFIRLSFPTKLPSYLISGTPIFCYGPSEVYSIRFMTENKLGFICNHQEVGELKNKIVEALTNDSRRDDFSKRSREFAINNFEATKVRSSFHQAISNCLA